MCLHEDEDQPMREQPPIPELNLCWADLDVICRHLTTDEARRVRHLAAADLFGHRLLREFAQVRLMMHFPNQTDISWDHPLYWSAVNEGNGRF